jgi:hypothetical protein
MSYFLHAVTLHGCVWCSHAEIQQILKNRNLTSQKF